MKKAFDLNNNTYKNVFSVPKLKDREGKKFHKGTTNFVVHGNTSFSSFIVTWKNIK